MPQLLKEWCRSIYDGEATINQPPLLKGFDPAKRQTALHPARIAAGINLPQGPAVSDVGYLANMITALVGAGAVGGPSKVLGLGAQPSTPNTKAKAPEITDSPVLPTPTKLPRFLEHAEKTLGVSDARSFESVMRRNGYGPDIMHLVDNEALEDIGMSKGDVLRIKGGASKWWNGPDAKRKREDGGAAADQLGGNYSGGGQSGGHSREQNLDLLVTPPNKKVAFELRYSGGGAQRLYGPRLSPGEPNIPEGEMFYRCPVRNAWVPVPAGYRAVIDRGEEENDNDDVFGPGPTALDGRDEQETVAAHALFNMQKGSGGS
ncbi:hypothetical protein K438DRAFT_1942479 [Mycena galopus ATCC 62051]|nr:hypothetical protein K438DRAFT_1942479 [Mycena galopus ATCC 62051]